MMISVFNHYINRFGKNVTVLHRTPKIINGKEAKNSRGRTIYNITEIPLRCRIKILRGDEKIVQNAILEEGDAIGLFKLSDAQYIIEDNNLIMEYDDMCGNSYKYRFKMYKPVFKTTHLEVKLKRVDM